MAGLGVKDFGGYRNDALANFWRSASQLDGNARGDLVRLTDASHEQASFTSVRSNRTCVDRLRDCVYLPKKSIVQQRLALTDHIRERLEILKNEADYVLPQKFERKLFSSRKYRDVTVGEMKDLADNIQSTVRSLPKEMWREAFPKEQWDKIIAKTREALDKAKISSESSRTDYLWEKSKPVIDCLKKCKKYITLPRNIAIVLFIGVFAVWATAGSTAAIVVGGGAAAIYAYYQLSKTVEKDDQADTAKLSEKLTKYWTEAFKEKAPGEYAGGKTALLLSSGENFASDVLNAIDYKGVSLSKVKLHRLFVKSFQAAAMAAMDNKLFTKVDRPLVGEKKVFSKLELGEKKYKENGVPLIDGSTVLMPFKGDSNSKVVVRGLYYERGNPLSLRLRNNDSLRLVDVLETAKAQDTSGNLAGYLGAVKEANGYIAQVYRDDRHLRDLSEVHRNINALGRRNEVKYQTRAEEFRGLLARDRDELENKLVQVGIPASLLTDDAFRVDTKGHLICNLGLRRGEVGPNASDAFSRADSNRSSTHSGMSGASFAASDTSGGTSDSGYASSAPAQKLKSGSVDSKSPKEENELRGKLAALLYSNSKSMAAIRAESETSTSSKVASTTSEGDREPSINGAKKKKGLFGRLAKSLHDEFTKQVDVYERPTRVVYVMKVEEAARMGLSGRTINLPA